MITNTVIVEPYDPSWPENFQKIKEALETVIGPYILRIEHVGSTSVPGLAAKPIIDLDIVIADDMDWDILEPRMKEAGYIHEGDLGIAGREAFRYEGKHHLQKHHPYVCRESSKELNRHTRFRDYLRTHSEDARMYGAVKQKAAELYPESIDEYMEYKSACIEELYRKSRIE